MRYFFGIITTILVFPAICFAQSFINPYIIYNNNPLPDNIPVLIDGAANPNGMIYTLNEQEIISGGYTGECTSSNQSELS